MDAEANCPNRKSDVIWRRIDDHVVAIEMSRGQAFELAGPAGRVWEILDVSPTLGDLAGQLKAEYDVEDRDPGAEVDRILEMLAKAGLLAP